MTKVVRECLFSLFFPRARPAAACSVRRAAATVSTYLLLSTVSIVVERIRIVGAAAPRRIIVAIGSFSESQVRLGALPSI